MQGRGGRRPTRQDEGRQRRKVGVEPVNFPLKPRHLSFEDSQRPGRVARCRQIGAEVEQVILGARQHGIEDGVVREMQTRQAEAGVGLVHRAVGLDPRIELVDALATGQPRSAAVPGPRIDFRQSDHLAAQEIDGGAEHDDRDELQKDAQPHQLVGIGPAEIAASKEGVDAETQGDQHGSEGEWNKDAEEGRHDGQTL